MIDGPVRIQPNGFMSKTNPTWKSNEEIAVLLMTRRSKTEAGRKVQAAVLFRVEMAIAIAEELAK